MIRLARRGKKNNPIYRVVVSEKGRDMFGNALEIVGTYSPDSKEKEAILNKDRILYWISKGAHASPTVTNLLISQQIVSGTKVIKKRTRKSAAEAATPSATESSAHAAEQKE